MSKIPKLPEDSVHQPTSDNPSPSEGLLKATQPDNTIDSEVDSILASAKANVVETVNCTTVAPNSKEIELTHTGAFKDGDVVSVRVDNSAGHPLYTATLKGYKLNTGRAIPYKIDVGTRISLLTFPETKRAITNLIAQEANKAREEERIKILQEIDMNTPEGVKLALPIVKELAQLTEKGSNNG